MTDSIFSIEHLNKDNYRFAKMYFEASHDAGGLTEYLQKKRFALADEKEDMARTYLVRYSVTGQIVAYFTLKNTSIPFLPDMNDEKNQKLIPGIELMNIALNNRFVNLYDKSKFEHLGSHIFKNFILPIIKDVSEKSGAKVLTLYAINSDVVKNFEKWGFVYVDDDAYNQKLTNEYTSYYSKKCNFMYKFINS